MREPSLAALVLGRFLQARRLARPDGRLLFRYGVADAEYQTFRETLEIAGRRDELAAPGVATSAVFVLYAAEWHRRDYPGDGQSWDAILPQVLKPVSYASKTQLCRDGLAWWRRAPRRLNGAEERLLSLAFEGGFPTRVLDVRERGWLSRFLRSAIAGVGRELEPDEQAAVEAARRAAEMIPPTFRQNEIFALAGELALALDGRKREAGLAPAGVPPSAWLDARCEGWRETLPIRLEGEGAQKLIDELVDLTPEGLAGDEEARCTRLLVRNGDGWAPGLLLRLDGWIRGMPRELSEHEGRLRVRAAGALADLVSGEIAFVEPAAEGGGWRARPRQTLPVLSPFPFSEAVNLAVAGERGVRSVTWPRGAAQTSEVLVFADNRDGADRDAAPDALELVGSGSVRSRRPELYVMTPAGFVARGADQAAAPIWTDAQSALFRIVEPTTFGIDGAWWRVAPGEASELSETLGLSAETPRGLQPLQPEIRLVRRPVTWSVRHGSRSAEAAPGEVIWRRPGEKLGHDVHREPLPVGRVDLIWRDAASQVYRDRLRLAVLPEGGAVSATPVAGGGAVFRMEQMDGWRLTSAEPAQISSDGGASLTMRFAGSPRRRVALTLHPPGGEPPIEVTANFPVADGGFACADGALVGAHERLMLHELRGARAFADGRRRLTIELRAKTRLMRQIPFEDEAPLWALAREIRGLASAFDEVDDFVRLTIDPGGRFLDVGAYAINVAVRRRTIEVERPRGRRIDGPVRLEWRSIVDPRREGRRILCEAPSLQEGLVVEAPDDLAGPGLVYLVANDVIVGRPSLLVGGEIGEDGLCDLQRASLCRDLAERREQMGAAYETIARGEGDWNLAYLHELVVQLDGLTPGALHVLGELPRHLDAAAHLIVAAKPELRETVRSLEMDLCFLWALVPVTSWAGAFARLADRLTATLQTAGIPSDQVRALVDSQQGAVARDLIALDETLAWPLALAGTAPRPDPPRSHREIANARLQRSVAGFSVRSVFHEDEQIAPHLPADLAVFDPSFSEALAAPYAAALRAADKARLTRKQVLAVRAWAEDDPAYFAEAFGAGLAELNGAKWATK